MKRCEKRFEGADSSASSCVDKVNDSFWTEFEERVYGAVVFITMTSLFS